VVKVGIWRLFADNGRDVGSVVCLGACSAGTCKPSAGYRWRIQMFDVGTDVL
jgi:hypothetical protein